MTAPYPNVNGTLAGQNVMYFFTYANDVTNHLFVLFTVIAFFLVILISSMVMQQRFTGRMRFDTALFVSSFATLGFAVLFEQVTGLLAAPYFITLVVITVLSFLWMAMTND